MTLGMQLGGSRLCRPSRRPGQSSTCTSGHLGSTVGLATAILLIVLLSCASNCGAFVMGISSFSFLERDCASCWSQGTPGSSARSACGGEGEDGALPQVEVSHQRSREGTSLDRYSRQPSLSREKLLEIGARVVASTLGVGVGSGGASRVAGGLLAGVPVAVGGWGVGLGQCVQSAEAFGGPSRPLNRCLVIAINAREFCRRLEADLAAGRNTQECRGMVKSVLRGLSLPESLKDAVLYLPGGKRQAATDAGQSAVEYLATVVEFDAWDKLDKDWTSNVALRNMTPDNVMFVRMALDASGSSLDVFLKQFDKADVDSAREVYREYFLPVEEQEQRP